MSHKKKRNPNGYWNDFHHVEEQIHAFIHSHGTEGVMPTIGELNKAGLSGLTSALTKHGSVAEVAERLQLTLGYGHKPEGYWNDFSNVERELLAFIEQHGNPGIMPTQNDLQRAKRSDLNNGIRRHGGDHAVATRLGLVQHTLKKPFRYWQDFTNIASELLAFIEEHGSSRVMPTSDELTQAGRADLVGAIATNGGFHSVAKQLGLRLSFEKKPHRYWLDFANVERELFSFIEQQGQPGVMPTQTDLKKAGRQDLLKAFRLHQGPLAIASQLKLKLSYTKKSRNYWLDVANVEQELFMFIQVYGTAGVMPTREEFRKAARHDLLGAIAKHGGVIKVAERLHLQPGSTAKPEGYWDDFSNVEQELLAFIQEHGVVGTMPTLAQLNKLDRSDLVGGIAKHGKSLTVAERLGLQLDYVAKPAGYWKDFSNVEQELLSFISQFGTSGVMPNRGELIRAGRNDLISAIKKHHGGVFAIAKRLGLQITMKPGGYWDDFNNITTELLTFIEHHGITGYMPTQARFKQANRSDLTSAIRKHGDVYSIAQRLGLKMENTSKPEGYWDDFSIFEHEILMFIEQHGTQGIMPAWETLKDAGRGDLTSAMRKFGGVHAVAQRLGLSMSHTKKAYRYWQNFTNLERELLALIEQFGTPGTMLTHEELKRTGRGDLIDAIMQYGGITSVAHRLGLIHIGSERITPTTTVELERIVRSLQPLAESDLLSGAQVMVILRRAGMLDYRNVRVTHLNVSLVHGEHNAIEQALTQLKTAPDDEATDTESLLEKSGQEEFARVGAESLVSVDVPVEENLDSSLISSAPLEPDLHHEQAVIRGLSALGEIRLPLDQVLRLLTSKLLWEAFYKRLYRWYGSLHTTQTVSANDIHAAILSAYPEHTANDFVAEASTAFLQEVEEAINFAAGLPEYGWTGPHLRLHQADAGRRMRDVLKEGGQSTFLLNADDPGMGKTAAFLAAAATSGLRSIIIVAPKTVADDTWYGRDGEGEIRRCLHNASIIRGLHGTLQAASSLSTQLTFYILHYEELLRGDAVAQLISHQFDCLCVDEIHLAKQRAGQEDTSRREALDMVRSATCTAIGLTGTPLVNELAEPLSILQLLSSYDPQFDYARLSNHRMSDVADVFEALLPHIVRRRKKDVLLHLPECDVRPIEIPLQEEGDIMDRVRAISRWPRAKTTIALGELRRLSLEAKLPYIHNRAETTEKLLVLTYLTDNISDRIVSYLEEFFPGQIAHINGLVSKDDRRKILDAFRAPDGVRILVGTIGTIGVGLTLFDPTQQHTAHEIIIADLPYTAAEFDQGTARLHREGQKHRVRVDVLQTTTTALLSDGSPLRTVDQRIWDLILGKRELSDVAIDGKYQTTDAAAKVRKALRLWLAHIRETGIEALIVERRDTEQSDAQKWRGEIARLRGMSAAKADDVFFDSTFTRNFLHHLETSPASKLAYQWLRKRLEPLLRDDLEVIDMGCGLNALTHLPCKVIGLDRHHLPGVLQGKMENPPLADKSADVLVYSLSLYGTPNDLRAYFLHAQRILRGGGHLFIVEPVSSFTPEGQDRFFRSLELLGFERVKAVDIRDEDGILLRGMHFTLTGEAGNPEEATFERK